MIDSLTVSILLFVALAIGAVVAFDAWRAWRLRRLSVRDETPVEPKHPARAEPKRPDQGVAAGVTAPSGAASNRGEPSLGPPSVRGEPSLGMTDVQPDTPMRAEPQLGLLDSSFPHSGEAARHRLPSAEASPLAAASLGEALVATERVAAPGQAVTAGSPFEYVDSRPVFTAQPRVGTSPHAAMGSSAEPLSVEQTLSETRAAPAALRAQHAESPRDPPPAAAFSSTTRLAATGASAVSQPEVASGILSDRTDCIALLRFVQPVPAEKLVSLGQAFRRSGSKPVMLEVLGLSPSLDEWHLPRAGESCSASRFGLLLANRAGPLNALEYTDFAQRIRELAASLGVGVEISDMASVLARARALDSESARLDAQVCINVDAAETLGPAQLASLAGPLAVVERGNNRYARLGPRGETIFSVALGEQSNRLSFLLDVPRVAPEARPFAAMIECVRISARRLPGRIIDDSGKPLTDRGIEAIMTQLDERCAALAAAGLAPGSATALRVFN
jgi:hypothetical protein